MAKFRDVAKGRRAIRRVTLPLVNVPCPLLPELPELEAQRAIDRSAWEKRKAEGDAEALPPDEELELGLRVLTGDEIVSVCEWAERYAARHGAQNARQGHPIYDLGYMAALVWTASVDPDANDPTSPSARFFESPDEILASEHIGRDGLIYLSECQETWQDMVSPQAKSLNDLKLWEVIEEAASSQDPRFLERLAPGMRWSLLRTLAALVLNSQTPKSASGSSSDDKPSPSPNNSASSSENALEGAE